MRFPRRGSKPEPHEMSVEVDAVGVEAVGEEGAGVAVLVEEMVTAPTTIVAAVNLLPPTYARRAALKRAKVFAALCVLAALLLSALAWMVAHQKEVAAQEALAVATAQRSALQAEAAKYAEVPRVFATVAAAEGQLELAMSNEVRWSFFLNDLALTMPSGVSLDTLAVTSPPPGATPLATAPSSTAASGTGTGASGAGVPGLGTMSVAARAMTYNTVANWLDSLAKLPTLSDPYVGSINAATEEDTEIVTYTSDATVTQEALSGRYSAQEVAR